MRYPLGSSTSKWILLLACGLVYGQVATSEFFGTVQDKSGSVIPGIEIRVISEAQELTYRTTTNELGYYSVPNLIPGTYRIEAQGSGFAAYRRTGLTAISARRIQIDIGLEVGAVTESVEVKGDSALLETGNNEIGQTIETRRVLELPLNGRNYLQLATLGVNATPFTTGERQGAGFVLGGSRFNSNNMVLDGVDNNTIFFNRDSARPPLDSVAEFRVITNSPSAEYGRNMGGVVTVITRSGTNDYRGTLYYFHRNNHLNAPPLSWAGTGASVRNPSGIG